MKSPINWLKQYIKTSIPTDKLSYKLTMAGLEVVGIEKKNGQTVFDIEITPNRPDLLSIMGIARETGAILNKPFKAPELKKIEFPKNKSPLTVEIKDYSKCALYTAKLIKNIKINNSPNWIKNRLSPINVKQVNNIVDITNFCLFETGHPLHAFDYEKIEGKKIIVRNAKAGEKIITIDDKERELTTQDLVIADEKKPIAIAGIIGGKNTEVTNNTKNLVIESAYFNPITIRKTARRLGLTTESSYRFERGTNLDMLHYSSNRAISLIIDSIKTAKPESFIQKSNVKSLPKTPKKIKLNTKKLEKYLDLKIQKQKIKRILNALQIKCNLNKDIIEAQPPSFRQDLLRDVDLIEEIIRVHGYNEIKSAIPLPTKKDLHKKNQSSIFKKNKVLRSSLINLGLNETITYSLINKNDLCKIKYDNNDIIKVKNPISVQQEILKPSMIPSMLHIISSNINHSKKDSYRFFEIGKTYHLKNKNNIVEKDKLIIALSETKETSSMKNFEKGDFFYFLKGLIKTSFKKLGIDTYKLQYKKSSPPEIYYPKACANIVLANETLGLTGYLLEEVCNKFNVSHRVVLAELDLQKIRKYINPGDYTYTPIIKYPSSYRDISFIIDKKVYSSKIEKSIYSTGKGIVSKVNFLDMYTGKQIPSDKKSLTYRIIYQSKNKTLKDKEINKTHKKIISKIKETFKAELR